MGAIATEVFVAAEAGTATVYLPGMLLGEILYLSEKGAINFSMETVNAYIREYPHIEVCPMCFGVTWAAREITDIPDLHDRLISATARFLQLPLITNDHNIVDSEFVDTVWE